MKYKKAIMVLIISMIGVGCAGDSKSVKKLTQPVDQTAGELVKVRELKSGGETRAIVSPADEGQLKIKF